MKAWSNSSGVRVAGGWLDPAVGDASGAAEGDAVGEGSTVGEGVTVGVASSSKGVSVAGGRVTVAGIVRGIAVAAGVAGGCSLTVVARQALVNRIRLQTIHTISGRRCRSLNGISLQVDPGKFVPYSPCE
jgi:hypothetical protein